MAGGFSKDSLHDFFGPRGVLSMAHACKLAQSPRSTIAAVTDAWNTKLLHIADTPTISGFAADVDGALLVALALKEPVANWIIDASDDLVKHPAGGRAWRDCAELCMPLHEVLSPLLAEAEAKGRRAWFTGHGVGGALAALAAIHGREMAPDLVDIVTFGAPCFGDPELAKVFARRFINCVGYQLRDDPLPIMPPHCVNIGDQEALDALAMRSVASAKVQRAAMTPERYDDLRNRLRGARDAFGAGAEANGDSSLAITLAGIAPEFLDHRLDRYIAAAGRVADVRNRVDGPGAGIGLQSWSESVVVSRGYVGINPPADTMEVSALLHVANDSWQPPDHVRVIAHTGPIFSVLCSAFELDRLARDPDVISVEESRPAGIPELQASVPMVKGSDVRRPPLSERGDRALIGIVDTGIDVLHETFLDAAGKTRILAIWDQADSTGPAPNKIDPRLRADFGTLHLQTDIDAMIAKARGGAGAPPPRLRDPEEHGTHVASIAAGRQLGAGQHDMQDGMAPDAKLLVVIPEMETEPGSPVSLGYSASHLAGLEFLTVVASGGGPITQQQRWPIAINCSLGMNAGAHDGTSLLEVGFDAVTKGGRAPGVVIVKSAGNERGLGGHTRVDAPHQGGMQVIEWTSTAQSRRRDRLEFWFSSWLNLAFEVVDPAGNRSGTVDQSNPATMATMGGNTCRITLYPNHIDNGDGLLAIDVTPASSQIQSGTWKLEIVGLSPAAGEMQIDGWVERDYWRAVSFVRNEDDTTISIPGTARTVIAVAACDTGAHYRYTSTSSSGLDRKHSPKPELIAPGEEIVAARANTANHKETTAMTGTSMAAPHVTGAIALALSARSKLPGKVQPGATQVRTALITTVVGANGRHSKDAGYGLLDAVRLINHIINLP